MLRFLVIALLMLPGVAGAQPRYIVNDLLNIIHAVDICESKQIGYIFGAIQYESGYEACEKVMKAWTDAESKRITREEQAKLDKAKQDKEFFDGFVKNLP